MYANYVCNQIGIPNNNLRFLFVRLPFSWKTPIGYSIYLTLEYLSVFAVALSMLPTICFAVGSYLLVYLVNKVIANDFHILCGKISTGKDKEVKKLFIDMIADMTEVEELSNAFNQLECLFINC